MNHLTQTEKKALELMQKENFRGISKDNVVQLVSILDKVDPTVAKDLIAQMPGMIRGIVETEKGYADLLGKGIESCERITSSCYETEDSIISSLQREIEREGTTFEQKQYYYEKMEAAVQRKESKDAEHKNLVVTILKYGGQALVFGICIGAGLFLGKTGFKLPGNKAALTTMGLLTVIRF